MHLYQRYIITSIVPPLLFCMVTLTGIVWLSQILRLMFLFEKQVNLFDFLEVIGLLIPALVHMILPFATLYASLYVYNNMKVNKELVVLENAGLDPSQLIRPILKLGVFLAVIGIINSSLILPKTYGILKDKLSYYRSNFVSSIIQEGMFNNISKNIVVFLNKKVNDKLYEGLILFDSRDQNNPSILLAEKGEMIFYDDTINLNLINGNRQSFNSTDQFEIMSFEQFKVSINNEKSSSRKFEERDMQEYYIWELLFPRDNSKNTYAKLVTEGNNRLCWPLFNIILPIVSISIFLRTDFNRRNYTKYLIKSFIVALFFIGLHFLIISYASRNADLNLALYLNLLLAWLVYHYATKTNI